LAAEFPLFPLLPWELRVMIWKFALRPVLPGAHVFSVNDTRDSEPNNPEHKMRHDRSPFGDSRLAPPRCLPRGVDFDAVAQASAPISWVLNNPSTYLIDSGLWTGCKESLLVIEKEFQKPKRRHKVWSAAEVESFRQLRGRFTLPETATYAITVASDNNSSRRRYITVFLYQDLFILQPDSIRAIDRDLRWDCIPSLIYSSHIALEYNPSWEGVGHKNTPEHAADLVLQNAPNVARTDSWTLWFIDYRIKRSPRYLEPAQEQADGVRDIPPRVFHASDRKFVEVKEGELGHWVGHDRMWDAGCKGSVGDFASSCSSRFVQRLREICESWYANDRSRLPDFDWVECGLLACEFLLTVGSSLSKPSLH
ncbi:hypothetical protein QBC47DRAFT_303028, partial [Echria macrotheca]